MGDGFNQGAKGAQIHFVTLPKYEYTVHLENIICTSLESYSCDYLFNTFF
jgi:hypothetical protein